MTTSRIRALLAAVIIVGCGMAVALRAAEAGPATASLRDRDRDGLPNRIERMLGTDPLASDSDGDGLSDGDEVRERRTDPMSADSDGDGMADGAEVAAGLDPVNPHDHVVTTATAGETPAPDRAGAV